MKPKRSFFPILAMLAILAAILACNSPVQSVSAPVDDRAIETAIAQTLTSADGDLVSAEADESAGRHA